jgi:alpha-1,3-glucosyltransferase
VAINTESAIRVKTLGAIAGVLSRNELVAAALFTLAINHKQVCLMFRKLCSFSHS